MDKQIKNISQPHILSGIAICSTAALGVYSIKNILDINKKLDVIISEINSLKTKTEDDKRRSNILSRKLEDLNHKVVATQRNREIVKVQEIVEVEEIEDVEEEEIEDSVNNFLKN